MREEIISFIFGDWSQDGHNQSDVVNLKINTEDYSKEAVKVLEEDEEKIKNELNINLETWFREFEDNKIPKEDVEKLNKLEIKYEKDNLTDSGELEIYHVDQYIEIWKQLIYKVDKDIIITEVRNRHFYGKCSGYGIYFL